MAALSPTFPAKRHQRVGVLLACLALASSAALSGCTVFTGRVTEYVPAPAVLQPSVDCIASMANSPGYPPPASPSASSPGANLSGSVPDGFVPETAFLCRLADVKVDGEPGLQFQQEELAGDFTPLLKALAVPSNRGDENTMCTLELEIVPILWLVNADGNAIQATWPTDVCGKTRGKPDTQKALDGLKDVQTQVLPYPRQDK